MLQTAGMLSSTCGTAECYLCFERPSVASDSSAWGFFLLAIRALPACDVAIRLDSEGRLTVGWGREDACR